MAATRPMSSIDLLLALNRIECPRILVLGDLILDRYTYGKADRISQEAPIPVLCVEEQDERLGGAANVCNMLRALGANVTCAGVVGDDEAGRTLRNLLQQQGVNHELVVTDRSRPTSVKERFIGRIGGARPGQLLRVDREVCDPLADSMEWQMFEQLLERLRDCDAVLISDYQKGVCTTTLTQNVVAAARNAGIPVLVDPARGDDGRKYCGATLIKPNRSELELGTGQAIETVDDAFLAGSILCARLASDMVMVTLDKDGMALVRRNGAGLSFPTHARSVYDITGAGDMVLAVLGVCLAAGVSPEQAAQLANLAAGLVVERPGVVVIQKDELRSEVIATSNWSARKIATLDEVAARSRQYQSHGRRVVFTNGCFDLLHVGHVTYLAEAARLGDMLIVGLNSDQSIRRLKGPQRPVIQECDRAAVVAALGCVDHVVIFDDDTPHRLLQAIRPNILVKGGTYSVDEVVGKEVVDAYGGQVCVTGSIPGRSTTEILRAAHQSSTMGNSQPVAKTPSPARAAGVRVLRAA